jgi:hypothetical protein
MISGSRPAAANVVATVGVIHSPSFAGSGWMNFLVICIDCESLLACVSLSRKAPMSRICTAVPIVRLLGRSCPSFSPLRLRVSILGPVSFLPFHVLSHCWQVVVVVVVTGDPSEVLEIPYGFDLCLSDLEFDQSCLVLSSSHVTLVLSDRALLARLGSLGSLTVPSEHSVARASWELAFFLDNDFVVKVPVYEM